MRTEFYQPAEEHEQYMPHAFDSIVGQEAPFKIEGVERGRATVVAVKVRLGPVPPPCPIPGRWSAIPCPAQGRAGMTETPEQNCTRCEQPLKRCDCGVWWCLGWTHAANRPVGGSHFCYLGSQLIAEPPRLLVI